MDSATSAEAGPRDKIVGNYLLTKVIGEVCIHIQVNQHPFIVKTHEIIETPSHVYIVMEHLSGGELRQRILKGSPHHPKKCLPEHEVKRLFAQIVTAVHYLHLRGIIHRDLKAENVLLDDENNAKLIDFGLVAVMNDPNIDPQSRVGSVNYAAPEMRLGRGLNPQCDVFSLGVLLCVMLTRRFPFDHPDPNVIFDRMSKQSYTIPFYVSPKATDLIHKMLVPDPKRRITMEQVLSHSWIREANPNALISAKLYPLISSVSAPPFQGNIESALSSVLSPMRIDASQLPRPPAMDMKPVPIPVPAQQMSQRPHQPAHAGTTSNSSSCARTDNTEAYVEENTEMVVIPSDAALL